MSVLHMSYGVELEHTATLAMDEDTDSRLDTVEHGAIDPSLTKYFQSPSLNLRTLCLLVNSSNCC